MPRISDLSKTHLADELPRPVYLVAPAGVDASGFDVPGRPAAVVRDPTELRGKPSGVLLLHPALAAEHVLAALSFTASDDAEWLPVLLDGDGDGGGAVRGRPISLGWPVDRAELARWSEGDVDADVFELRHVLTRVARARHDLNNPLTSAMAEAQLALMEARDPVIREGLQVIEEQLRRMRDLIASLKALRPG